MIKLIFFFTIRNKQIATNDAEQSFYIDSVIPAPLQEQKWPTVEIQDDKQENKSDLRMQKIARDIRIFTVMNLMQQVN